MKAYHHKESHKNFRTKEDLERYIKSYEKNPKWTIMNSSRFNAVMSATNWINKIFPFVPDTLDLPKFYWYKKEMIHKGYSLEDIQPAIEYIKDIEKELDEAREIAAEAGNIAHHNIQELIKNKLNVKKSNIIKGNQYTNLFINEIDNKDNEIIKMIKNIKKLLPFEEQVIQFYNHKGQNFGISGQWDMLFKTKDGKKVLVDIKTGSELKFQKKKNVNYQLNLYRLLYESEYFLKGKIDEMYCWEIAWKQDDKGNRDYYMKSHKIEKSNKILDLIANYVEKQEIIKGR